MREGLPEHLTVAVCENYYPEATVIVAEKGWNDVSLISFPAACGQPLMIAQKLNNIVPTNGEAVVLGGACLLDQGDREALSFRVQANCFSYICSSSQVKQLLRERSWLVSSGWLRGWRERIDSLGFGQSQYQKYIAESSSRVVCLDTLVEENGSSSFADFLHYTGMEGQRIEVGCEVFSLHLSELVAQWRQKMTDKRLRQARSLSAQSSMILGVLDSLEPAASKKAAINQLVQLFNMFMAPRKVDVEIVSNAGTAFRFKDDRGAVSLGKFSEDGLYRSPAIDGFYLLVQIDQTKSAVIRVAEIYLSEKLIDYINLTLSLKGLIRLILYNAFLHDELRVELTHKEQIEKYLEKSEQYFRILYENAPLPYHCLDASGRILEVNNAWLKTLGYTKEEVVGQFFEHFLVQDYTQPYNEFKNRLTTNTEVSSIGLKAVKSDLTSIHIHLDATQSKDHTGVIQQTHCIFVDVTGQNKIQELILQSEKLSTIAGLAAGVAHEINTPLSGIMQSAQLIEMFVDPENEGSLKVANEYGVDLWKFKEYSKHQELDYFINGIRTSALAASGIIRNLLEFSRPGKGEWKSVSLIHLFEQIINLIQSDYDLKKKYNVINVIFDVKHDTELPSIYCVAVEIEQVFFNIIKNAIHAMGKAGTEKPRVVIRSVLRQNVVRIEVEDNGPGIKPEIARHVFDPFFTTKEPGEGTGLGLSISYTIVTGKHQGAMWVDMACKTGTRFIVEIPAARKAKALC